MLAGHFGLAAGVKSQEQQIPLWALMLSTQLLDVVFLVLYAFGIENMVPEPGKTATYGNFTGNNIFYSHSLVGALIISLIAFIVAAIPWGRRNGLIIGAVVFSHWILDLIVHRPDLAVLPGNAGNLPLLGLGLWNIPWLSFVVEMAIILVGAFLYYRAAMGNAARAAYIEARGSSSNLIASAAAASSVGAGLRRQALLTAALMLIALFGTLIADALIPMQ
jgi:hypothetical protein